MGSPISPRRKAATRPPTTKNVTPITNVTYGFTYHPHMTYTEYRQREREEKMAQYAHNKADQNRGIPVRARQAQRPPPQRRQRARSQPVNPQNMDRTTQEGNSMKKLAAVIALSTLALGACSTADDTQNEYPSVNATATVPEAYAEEPGLKGEPDEITEPATEN